MGRTANGLRQALGALSDRRLLLKPDIYTHLGVYSGNEWALKPTTASLRL